MRTLALLLVILAAFPAGASDDMSRVMQLWCTQAGVWVGEIDITEKDGQLRKTKLTTHHDCPTDNSWHIVREQFGNGPTTVKVTYVDPKASLFRTAYFVNAKQEPFAFAHVRVEAQDDRHWTTVIASPEGTETYENRPAVLRYVRVRAGDRIENLKEVKFLDGAHDFVVRSKIVQTLRRE